MNTKCPLCYRSEYSERPGGLVGYPRASLKSILWVQFSPIAHSRRDFLHKKSDQRTAREREFATFGENRRAVRMLTPMSDKNEGTYRGGEGTTPVTTACPEDR